MVVSPMLGDPMGAGACNRILRCSSRHSPASFEPTLRTLASFGAPTTVLPHQRFSTIDAEDEERLEQVTKKASQLSGSILRLKQTYAKCTIPDSTSEFDQLASEIFNKNSLTLKEEQLNEVVVPLNTRISYKHKSYSTTSAETPEKQSVP